MVGKFFFLSGLPRSGSTLLSAILSQNKDIHAEGNSALCQLMWDSQQSCKTTAFEQLAANNRFEKMQSMLCATLPYMFYDGVEKKYVVDKCRSWALPDNMQMIRDYITDSPKVIVLVRPIEDIVRSFMQLNIDNNRKDISPEDMLREWSEPIMRSYNGAMFAKNNNNGEFLFVDYDRLVDNTKTQLQRIYKFFDIETATHDLNNIKNKHQEIDEVYGLKGQHDIRPSISKRNLAYKLPSDVYKKCSKLTADLYSNLDIGE